MYDRIIKFSYKLEEVLKIDIEKYARDYKEIQQHTSNYVIYLEDRHWQGNWDRILEVAPRYEKEEKIIRTWNLTKHIPDSFFWHYKFDGICTENLPTPLCQQVILDEINKETVKTYWIDLNDRKNFDNITKKIINEKIESRFEILDIR